ncbi:Hcp family type VI secretion system effector [Schlesneria paludicola]|uniref:Hcp family type VI secretion system effector n=1 Tax=Schlesneria paludicola TaxID=360056 RepID=UPI00029ABCCF|nr:type VI secretion system tube protein Hcp [Schlesneria paludicola]
MLLMMLPGITGDSIVEGFVGWISLGSVQFGVGRGVSSAGVGMKDRDTSTPSISEVVVTKMTDITSTLLFAEATYGDALDNCIIALVQTGGKDAPVQEYWRITLTKPILSGWSLSSGGDRPSESISINFNKIVMKYTQFTDGGDPKVADPKGYDLTTGKPASA